MPEMHTYTYDGPVERYGKCIASHWHGQTMASSIEKAKSNLAYQCKRDIGLMANMSITLPSAIKESN